jgi:hypothetical protein
MTALSCGFGIALGSSVVRVRLTRAAPALGLLAFAFGAWYAAAAIQLAIV